MYLSGIQSYRAPLIAIEQMGLMINKLLLYVIDIMRSLWPLEGIGLAFALGSSWLRSNIMGLYVHVTAIEILNAAEEMCLGTL